MKTLLHTLWAVTLLSLALNMQAKDYVMLTPLDTTSLPTIPDRDYGGQIVRRALDSDALWSNASQQLSRKHFSNKSIYRLMLQLYRSTHKHYVTFPVAYWSQTPQGDSLLVSGRVYLPERRYLNGIVVASHYTIGSDEEAPSNIISFESLFTMKGYAVIMPDYVGYGLSRDELHPYLHWRSAAQTALDLLCCMPALLEHYGYNYPTDVVIEGYSQGGAVALGIARMIEEQDTSFPWTIRKLYAGAGPYDPAATYLYSVTRDEIGIPAAIPLIVMGMNDAYDLEFQLQDIFLEPLLSHYPEWILTKQYTIQQINQLMGTTIMSQLMTPAALDFDSPVAKALYGALRDNTNVGYDLQAPAYFLHSIEDEVVPIINSEYLVAQMPDDEQISYDFGKYGSHIAASIPFIKYVYQDL